MPRPGAPRLVLAAFASGLVGGAVAGVAARSAMWVIRLMNPTYAGQVTHAGYEVGRWTISGTMNLVAQGLVTGAVGGAVYLLLRPLFPRRRSVVRGLLYGLVLLAAFGGVVLDGSYEYFRFVSTWLAVALWTMSRTDGSMDGMVARPASRRSWCRPTGGRGRRVVRAATP